MVSCYSEIEEEKSIWDEKAKTVKDDIELRGKLKNPLKRLEKSRRILYNTFKNSGKSNMLLDVGCGNALFTVPLAEVFNFVVGIDISKDMIKRCHIKKANLDFIMASATDLPIQDGVFDAVMSLSLLQHVKPTSNVEKILKEISRVAADDSFIFITFWDAPNSPTKMVKNILKEEGFHLKQSLISKFKFLKLNLTRYVKLQGYRVKNP